VFARASHCDFAPFCRFATIFGLAALPESSVPLADQAAGPTPVPDTCTDSGCGCRVSQREIFSFRCSLRAAQQSQWAVAMLLAFMSVKLWK